MGVFNEYVILNKIGERDFEQIAQVDRTNWYFEKNNKDLISLVAPHSGTNFKWMLRADFTELFDRWGNCLFERFFKDEEEMNQVLVELDDFFKNRDNIIKEELEENAC